MALDWDEVEAAGLLEGAAYVEDRRAMLAYFDELGFSIEDMVLANSRGSLLRLGGEPHVRPLPVRLSLASIAEEFDVDLALVVRVWEAVAAIDVDADEVGLDASDRELVRTGLAMIRDLGEDAALGVLRVMGSALDRATEALSSAAVAARPDISVVSSGSEALSAKAWTEITALAPAVGALLDTGFRHRIDGVRRLFEATIAEDDNPRVELVLGIGFLDLSGYTETSHAMDLEGIGDLVAAFESETSRIVRAHQGRVVKYVGDAALFSARDPAALAAIADELVHDATRRVGLRARAGLAYGRVLAKDGDYFGTPVNAAARLVDGAEPGTILATQDLAVALGETATWRLTPMPPRRLRGFPDPVAVVAVERPRPA